MKKTVWCIEEEVTTLEYYHSSEEIFIKQDVRRKSDGKVMAVCIEPSEVDELMQALAELKTLLDAEKAG